MCEYLPELSYIGRMLLTMVVAIIVGGIVGLERQIGGKPAGFRTYALVSLGAAMYAMMALLITAGVNKDPTRVIANIVTGVSFLGAGLIIKEKGSVQGLTTAASIWASAALGAAVGAQLYGLALAGAVIVLLVLIYIKKIKQIFKIEDEDSEEAAVEEE